MQSENHPVPELTNKTVDGTDPPFTAAFGDPMLQEIHSAYGVSQDKKLQEAKKQPVRPLVAKKPLPPTPTPKPHVHQKKLQEAKLQPVHPPLAKKPTPKPRAHQKTLQEANSVDPIQIPRRKTKHKGEWRQRSRER